MPNEHTQDGAPGQGQPLTETALANAFAQAMQRQQQQQPQQQQQRQLSQEEIDQMLATYRPDMSLVEDLFGEGASNDKRLGAFNRLVQGIIANATAHSRVLADSTMGQFYQHLQPALEDVRHISQQRFFDSIYDGHPQLKQYEPLLKQTLPAFQQDPTFPQDRGQRPQYVREKFIEQLKAGGIQYQPQTQSPQGGSQYSGQQRQHAVGAPTSIGTGGGTGAASPQGGAASSGLSEWTQNQHGF